MLFISKAQELKNQNAEVHAHMGMLLQRAKLKNRNLTADEKVQWDRLDAEFEARGAEIARWEKHEGRGNGSGLPFESRAQDDALRRELARRTLREFLTRHSSDWSSETRKISEASISRVPSDKRALSAVTGAAGGYLIPKDFMPELERAQKSFSGMFDACRVVQTGDGSPLDWPKVDDTANVGELLAEGSATADTADPTFGQVTLKAYQYSSKNVRVPLPLTVDAYDGFESDLFETLGARIARVANPHLTTGTGTAQPRGLITALLADTTPVAAGSSIAITYDDLVNLEHAIDPAYRNVPGMAFMLHYDILKALKKLKDSNSRPIFMAGDGSPGRPNSIMGWPYFINQDMDNTIASGKETLLFGLVKKYLIRRGGAPLLLRLQERYAEYLQVGFVLLDRLDGQLVMGGNKAIQVLQHP